MGPFECPRALVPGQPGGFRRWHPCCRRCLLKDCERWFLPPRPQARYCSPACREAAEHWRSWHAGQTYRATNQGKERRREQARRHRERATATINSCRAGAPQHLPSSRLCPVIEAQTTSDSTPIIPAGLRERRPAPRRNSPRILRFAVRQAWVLRPLLALAPFSRSTFLFRLMPPGITASSPARSPTQTPTPPWCPAYPSPSRRTTPRPHSVMSSRP